MSRERRDQKEEGEWEMTKNSRINKSWFISNRGQCTDSRLFVWMCQQQMADEEIILICRDYRYSCLAFQH